MQHPSPAHPASRSGEPDPALVTHLQQRHLTCSRHLLRRPITSSFRTDFPRGAISDHGDCVASEEAFAKACHKSEIFISDQEVIQWAQNHGVLEGAYLNPGAGVDAGRRIQAERSHLR
jgi:hypothetical protein